MFARGLLLTLTIAILAAPMPGEARPRTHRPITPHPSAIEEAAAGMAALDRQAYDEALQRFNAALNSGDLAGDDEELAYLSRAKAFDGKADYGRAIVDLKRAVALKPDDTEAQADLQLAIAQRIQVAGVQPGQDHPDSAMKTFGKTLLNQALTGLAQRLQDASDQQQ